MIQDAQRLGATAGPAAPPLVVGLKNLGPDDRRVVGGKAANLGRLLRAELPVPTGFCVTCAAFRLWLSQDRDAQTALAQLTDPRLRASPAFGPGGSAPAPEARPDTISHTAATLRDRLSRIPMPSAVARAITERLESAPASVAWAVRSSATTEDQPTRSFAGQHDTRLGVTGSRAVLEAVRQCWVSLYSDRAVSYRLRHPSPGPEPEMAVVVQHMVTAECSGVVFTADPVTGNPDHLIIEAVRGSGESLVSGHDTPQRSIAAKACLRDLPPRSVIPNPAFTFDPGPTTTRDRASTLTEPAPLLDPTRLTQLARLSLQVEQLFGGPQDLEWAATGDQVFLLQARPITTGPLSGPSRSDDAPDIWTNANAIEAFPDVVTPLGWSLLDTLLTEFLHPLVRRVGLSLRNGPLAGLVAGRAYLNLRTVIDLFQAPAGPLGFDITTAFGGLHANLRDQLPHRLLGQRSRWTLRTLWGWARLIPWLTPALLRQSQWIERWQQRVRDQLPRMAPAALSDDALAEAPARLLQWAALNEDDRTWAAAVWMAAAGVGGSMAVRTLTRRWLEDHDGSIANRLLAGAEDMNSAENGLALVRLADWARPHPALAAALLEPCPFADLERKLPHLPHGAEFRERWRQFLAQHGHQARGGMDIAQPRWSETPDFVLGMLRNYLRAGEDTARPTPQQRRLAARESGLAELRRLRHPLRRRLLGTLVRLSQRGLAQRENVKNEGVRLVACLRYIALEIGRRLAARGIFQHPDEIFFLRFAELGPVLRGQQRFDLPATLALRKAAYARYQCVHPPPVIVGRFTLADDRPGSAHPTDRVLQGLAVSPGVVTGPARVILQAHTTETLQPGEILVAPYTDPGWTPYFLAAAGLVADVGGLLSHGSVVAREYGLPAVVNVGPATRWIRTGQRLRVDGNAGTVTLVETPDLPAITASL